MTGQKTDLRSLDLQEMQEVMLSLGEAKYRAAQVFQWTQVQAAQDFSQFTNLGKGTLFKLQELLELRPLKLLEEKISSDGTRKFLWELADQNRIESVLLLHQGDYTKNRATMCLSSQAGCAMGCTFCATGRAGFQRNLTTGEIVGQVLDATYHLRRETPDFKVNNLVYMGMGEPLLNLPALLKSITILNHKDGQNIGIRRITVSTCGLVPQMMKLAEEKLDIVLAVSLHAPSNELRDQIMPVNRQFPLEVLMPACRRYQEITGRRITFEYALIKDFNDGELHARLLAGLLDGLDANINLIPVNSVAKDGFTRPNIREIKGFAGFLQNLGCKAVIREEKGSDIEAACGQLAGRYTPKSANIENSYSSDYKV